MSVFQQRLRDWVDAQFNATDTTLRAEIESLYVLGARHNLIGTMEEALKKAKENGVFVSAQFARRLCWGIGLDMWQKSHTVFPRVLNWWNTRSFANSMELCYYAGFNDDLALLIQDIPPPPPKAGPPYHRPSG